MEHETLRQRRPEAVLAAAEPRESRLLTGVGAAAILALLLLAVPLAGTAWAESHNVRITSPASGDPVVIGEEISVAGEGCLPGAEVDIRIEERSFATTMADDRGAFVVTTTLPDYHVTPITEEAVEERPILSGAPLTAWCEFTAGLVGAGGVIVAVGTDEVEPRLRGLWITSPLSQIGHAVEGEELTVAGVGCPPGGEVVVQYGGVLATTLADDDGSYTATGTVPIFDRPTDIQEEVFEPTVRVDCGGEWRAAVVIPQQADQVEPRPEGSVAAGDGSVADQGSATALLGVVMVVAFVVALCAVFAGRSAARGGRR